MARVELLQFESDSFIPPASAHPDRGIQQSRPFWAFDDTTVETLRSKAAQMPQRYNGGTIKADVLYIMASATSGAVDIEISVEAVTEADALDLDSAESFATANAVTDTVPTTAGHLGIATVTLTNADSVAVGDMVRFKLERDADDAADTAAGDLRLIGISIWEDQA